MRIKSTTLLLLCSLAITYSLSAHASSKDPGKVIAGYVEKISVESSSVVVKAKLDTGAKTSSAYARNIEMFRKDSEKWVRFELVLKDDNDKVSTIKLEKPRVRRVKIKNHDGDHDRRAVVNLTICFDGRWHETEFTLANRSEYIYGFLLGREFLNGVAVVDPEKTFQTMASCHQK